MYPERFSLVWGIGMKGSFTNASEGISELWRRCSREAAHQAQCRRQTRGARRVRAARTDHPRPDDVEYAQIRLLIHVKPPIKDVRKCRSILLSFFQYNKF